MQTYIDCISGMSAEKATLSTTAKAGYNITEAKCNITNNKAVNTP